MKLKELEIMDSQDRRIYNALIKFILFGCDVRVNGFYTKFGSMAKLSDEIKELEIKDILDMYSKEELMNARGIGIKSIERLKELV